MQSNDFTERRDIKVDAVFDIETEDWEKFVVGGIWYADGTYEEYGYEKESQMVDAILEINGAIWAHSGGTFDTKWLLDHVADRGFTAQIVATGSRIVTVRIGHTKIFDSAALIPISLKKFTEGQGVTKMRLEFPCVCGRDCGGFCAIRRDMNKVDYKILTDYLRADCASLFEGLTRLREFAAENDLDLGATIGSSAWRNARRYLGLPDATLEKIDHEFARRGYYGGRVQLFRPGLSPEGYEYDVNSMYPWTLRTFPVPVGDGIRTYGADARRNFESGKDGIFKAKVLVPESHIPPLPYRYDNGTRIAYPFGSFVGTWAGCELRYAQSVGASIEIVEGIVWDRSDILFTSWIEKMFALRRLAPGGKKSPLGTFLKLYMNSLTGKFGSNPEKNTYVLNPEQVIVCTSTAICPRGGRSDCRGCCSIHCSGRCGCHAQISKYLYMSQTYRLEECSHVEWAAHLTAQARITLNQKQLEVDDGLDMIYSDTDSIFSLKERPLNVGLDLGQWDAAGKFEDFYGIAPKCYEFGRDDKMIRKAKGIKLYPNSTLEPGKLYEAEGIIGVKTGIKEGKFFKKKKLGRRLSVQYGDRVLVGDGITRAPDAEELG